MNIELIAIAVAVVAVVIPIYRLMREFLKVHFSREKYSITITVKNADGTFDKLTLEPSDEQSIRAFLSAIERDGYEYTKRSE